jgi:hypothetical protein
MFEGNYKFYVETDDMYLSSIVANVCNMYSCELEFVEGDEPFLLECDTQEKRIIILNISNSTKDKLQRIKQIRNCSTSMTIGYMDTFDKTLQEMASKAGCDIVFVRLSLVKNLGKTIEKLMSNA